MASYGLRSSSKLTDILSESPSEQHLEIVGSKLPTYEQTLLCFLANLNRLKSQKHKIPRIRWEAAKAAVSQVLVHYYKAGIPAKNEKSMAKIIEKLYDDFQYVMYHTGPKRDSFKKRLQATMPFWPTTVIQDMEKAIKTKRTKREKQKITTDLQFLKSMMANREATYGSKDRTAKTFQKSLPTNSVQLVDEIETETNYVSDNSDDNVPVFNTPSTSNVIPHRRLVKTGTTIHLKADFLDCPLLTSVAIRNKMNPTSLSNIMTALIQSCNGDTSAVNLSYSQTEKYMKKSSANICTTIQKSWVKPSQAFLHWDGKTMDALDKMGKEERLPVLVSGIGGVKLLGVPILKKLKEKLKKGTQIAEASVDLLNQWECKDNIVGLVFDTTASNTGQLSAACVSLQKLLEKPMLWCACRHHVGEVVINSVWQELDIEKSSGKKPIMFGKFKEMWNDIYKPNELVQNLYFPLDSQDTTEIMDVYNNFDNHNFARNDYKELLDLCRFYLGALRSNFKIQKPGAIHHARWMGKLLSSFKIVILAKEISSKLPKDTIFTVGQLEKLERFVQFAVLVYIPWWLTSPIPQDAPQNDFIFVKKSLSYPDKICSDAAVSALQRHMWYLTEELVPLSLFANNVNDATKSKIAEKLLHEDKQVS